MHYGWFGFHWYLDYRRSVISPDILISSCFLLHNRHKYISQKKQEGSHIIVCWTSTYSLSNQHNRIPSRYQFRPCTCQDCRNRWSFSEKRKVNSFLWQMPKAWCFWALVSHRRHTGWAWSQPRYMQTFSRCASGFLNISVQRVSHLSDSTAQSQY